MFELPGPELTVLLSIVVVYLAAAAVGVLQLRTAGEKHKYLLSPLIALAVALEAVMLIFRAVTLKAIPLTGLFESMIILTIVFGLIYLFLAIVIRQVWFGSVMAWAMLAIILMAGVVAGPASEPHAAAATPWAITHGIAMVLGGASITFATVSAMLYLLGRRGLKQKRVMQVLGRVPNMERLEHMTLLGLKASFMLITFGLISGVGLAAVKSAALQISALDWLTDAKFVLIVTAWVLLGAILALRRMLALKGKMIAHMTMLASFLILFAIVGAAVFCGTKHNFAKADDNVAETREQVQK